MADAAEFARMVRRVEGLPDDEFAGAVVIQPPGDAVPIAFVTSNPNPNLVMFWASVKSLVEVAYGEAMANAAERDGGKGWGR